MERMLKATLVAAAAVLMLAPVLSGCDEESTPIDTSTDSQDIPAEEGSLPPGCGDDIDSRNPGMRMIFFDLQAPTALDNAVLENLMIEGFDNGDFIWLIDFSGVDDGSTDSDGTLHLFTGSGELVAGTTLGDNCFTWMNNPSWQPAEANLNITGDDVSWPPAETKISITIPVFKTDPVSGVKNLLLELPLKDVEVVSGSFSADRMSMGTRTNCSTTGGGVLNGMITVEDARGVIIEDMGVSLCGMLSGDTGSNLTDPGDDCLRPIAEWSKQPDAELSGQPAYTMAACFSAEAVNIVE
jgi:hypothetical protein